MPDALVKKNGLDLKFVVYLISLLVSVGITAGALSYRVSANEKKNGEQDEKIERIDKNRVENRESLIEVKKDVSYIKAEIQELNQVQQVIQGQIQEEQLNSKLILAELKKINGNNAP